MSATLDLSNSPTLCVKELTADIPTRVILIAAGADFKVDVRTGRVARVAHRADHIALINDLTGEDIDAT